MSLLQRARAFLAGTETRSYSLADLDKAMDAWFAGGPTWSGESVGVSEAQNLATVYRCISLIAETVASLPLQLYRRVDESRIVARSNYLYPLIHDYVNPLMTAYGFREAMMRDALGWGNGWAVKERDRSQRVVALWRLDPSRCEPSWDEEARAFFVRYRPKKNGPHIDYLRDDLFQVMGPTDNGLVGYSVIRWYARNSLGAGLSTQKFSARFFKNQGRPSGILVHPQKLTKERKDNIINGWQKMTGGESTGSTAVLEEGVTYTPVSINPEDAQLAELMDHDDHEQCKWFGVPPVLAGVVSRTTSWGTGIEQLNIGFLQYTLTPWLKRYEGGIARDLLDYDRSLYAEHEVAGLLRGDLKTQAEYLRTMVSAGIMDFNEVRAKLNLNPVEAGAMFARPTNTTFIAPDGSPIEALQPPAPNPPQGNADEPSAN